MSDDLQKTHENFATGCIKSGLSASKTDIENVDCRDSVSMGLMGSAEPINFEKRVLEPINF